MERFFEENKVMKLLIIINVAVFLLTDILKPGIKDYVVLIKPLAVTGDYWRFFTCMFAHGDIFHLLFNMFCLYFFGQVTEYFFGSAKFLFIYIIAGLIGSFASTFFSVYSSLGASGAVFGIVGANFYTLTKTGGDFKRKFKSDLIMFVVVNLGMSIYRSNIDLAAHVGGLVGGIMAGFAIGIVNEAFDRERILKTVGAVALTAVIIFGVTFHSLSNLDTQKAGIVMRYQTYGAKNALACADKARARFPKDPEIKQMYYELQDMVH